MAYQLTDINFRTISDPKEFVEECDARYEGEVKVAAEMILENRGKSPIILLSGSEDPVGNYGRGVQEVYRRLIKYGKNAQIKLYPDCRHEILNDVCRDEVIRDILVFSER